MSNFSEMLTVTQVADLTGWCKETIRRKLRNRSMPGRRHDREWLIPEDEFRIWYSGSRGRRGARARLWLAQVPCVGARSQTQAAAYLLSQAFELDAADVARLVREWQGRSGVTPSSDDADIVARAVSRAAGWS